MYVSVNENVTPNFLFKKLQEQVLHMDFAWYYVEQTTYGNFEHEETENKLYQHSMFHSVIVDGQYNSPVAPLVDLCIASIFEKNGIPFNNKILRARFVTQIVSPTSITHKPHVDTIETKYTGFLYMNDSDGDSVVYDQTYDVFSGLDSFQYYKHLSESGFTVRETITPKANKAVLFESPIYHSSSSPSKTSRRIVLNFSAD